MSPKKQHKTEETEDIGVEAHERASITDGEKLPEIEAKNSPVSSDLPEQSDGIVEGFTEPPPVPVDVFDYLSEMMKLSEQETGVDPTFFTPKVEADQMEASPESGLVIPTAEEVKAVLTGNRMPPLLHMDAQTGAVTVVPEKTGPQPNGDYGIVVQIPEALVQGVMSQAELERETPEAWLSKIFGDYLEGWFYGKG